jgi:hypothetical protein
VDEADTSAIVNSVYVRELLDKRDLLEVDPDAVQPNDVVLYFSEGELKHAGRVTSVASEFIIRSKWGGNEVHDHGIWEAQR